jgi:aminopeptidase N
MKTDSTPTIRLEDYAPPAFLVDSVHLDIRLDAADTRVRALLSVRRNPAADCRTAPLVLDGDELALVSLQLNGVDLDAVRYSVTPAALTIPSPPDKPFSLTIETRLSPETNTKLMGLYRSSGVYCTQCEADGFRRITYFPDRPDVMSIYTVRLEAEKSEAPILLSNGNRIAAGDVPGASRHFAVWQDPWPKPAYLFALVGGDLGVVSDHFVTASGRRVELGVYVEKGKEPRAGYAMDAIKRSMAWDERAFGREYDLDVFNVVAVSDFNMGAMENKGLNIFNDKYVLASPETATDADYGNIEGIIAHEYFHNWTGNRITCRDWFQLCLKEGLTVYRDQEFTADERSRPVKRIADVIRLRLAQFVEDAGPLAHNVRPRAYKEINNFYTATVYEKGAELVRMLHTLLGAETFRRGIDIYFAENDGTAATVEDFLAAFASASGKDLTHFAKWYDQAGTPTLVAAGVHDAVARTYTLDLAQSTPATPGQEKKAAMVIPIRLGLVGAQGDMPLSMTGELELAGDVLVLDRRAATVTFHDVAEPPVPSLLRGFSAPVHLDASLSTDELLSLAQRDSDPFNRWQALRVLMTREIIAAVSKLRQGMEPAFDSAVVDAVGQAAREGGEHAYTAQLITPPRLNDIAREIGQNVDPDAVHMGVVRLARTIGSAHAGVFARLHDDLAAAGAYSPDAASAGRRSLRQAALNYLCEADADGATDGSGRAFAQFSRARNMTDRLAALNALALRPGPRFEEALSMFEAAYRDDPLVLDKWFAIQAAVSHRDTLARVKRLMQHPGFSMRTPNRVYALISSFAHGNLTEFNRPDGASYDFIGDLVVAPRCPACRAMCPTSQNGLWPERQPARTATMVNGSLRA